MMRENLVTSVRKEQVENLMNNFKFTLERKYWTMYFNLVPDSGTREEIIGNHNVISCYTENLTNRIDASFYRKDKYAPYLTSELDRGLKDKAPYNLSINIIYSYNSENMMKFYCKRHWYDSDYEHNMSEDTFNINTSNLNISNLVQIFDRCYDHLGEKTLAERRKDELNLDDLERRFG